MNEETNSIPIVVAYGGGVNSTAMLCGVRERGIRPDLILFSDTGGELPHTYVHIQEMNRKTLEWWGVPIEIVRENPEGLEGECLRRGGLPSLAFGTHMRGCSDKWKQRPQRRRVTQWMEGVGVKSVRKMVGFDAGESHRVKPFMDKMRGGKRGVSEYPLVEWGWRRADCIEAIERNGVKQPGKSSCFFCPAMKSAEILALRQNYPEHLARALALEDNVADSCGVKGLNFGAKWSEILKADSEQLKLFAWMDDHATPSKPCGCFDG